MSTKLLSKQEILTKMITYPTLTHRGVSYSNNQKRLTKQDFDASKSIVALAFHGEIFCDANDLDELKIVWDSPELIALTWSDYNKWHQCPTIETGCGHGFAGWDPSRRIYLRYDDLIAGNEHCLKVFLKDN